MANTNKKTINTEFKELIDIVKNANISEDEKTAKVAFLEKRIELNKKKNGSGSGKLNKTQTENEAYKAQILEEMESGREYTISEMCKELPTCVELDKPNKVNALVKQLKDCGAVIRTEKKGRAYFTKAEVEGE